MSHSGHPPPGAGGPEPDLERLHRERLDRVRTAMDHQGVDALVLLHGPHITYATGHVPPPVDATHATFCRPVVIVTPEAVRLHAGPADPAGRDAGEGVDVQPPLWPELDETAGAFAASVAELVGEPTGRRVAVDELTGAMRRHGVLDGAELADAGRVLGPARLTKTVDELACIDRAQRLNEEAMETARAAAVPGARRSEVAGAFLRRLVELGGAPNLIDPIFEPIPRRRDGGARTSTGHVAFPTGVGDPTYAEGDLVWVDSGIGVHGYVSDFGRTWVVGREPIAAEQDLFDRWEAVVAAVEAVTGPGASLGDLCRAAVRADTPGSGGERPWLPHFYLAHGIGVASAEAPMAGTDLGAEFDDAFLLAAGMVLVLEPVTWRDGDGGYRAEVVLAVTDDGCRELGGGLHYLPFRSRATAAGTEAA